MPSTPAQCSQALWVDWIALAPADKKQQQHPRPGRGRARQQHPPHEHIDAGEIESATGLVAGAGNVAIVRNRRCPLVAAVRMPYRVGNLIEHAS
jgi:hypothetical protein